MSEGSQAKLSFNGLLALAIPASIYIACLWAIRAEQSLIEIPIELSPPGSEEVTAIFAKMIYQGALGGLLAAIVAALVLTVFSALLSIVSWTRVSPRSAMHRLARRLTPGKWSLPLAFLAAVWFLFIGQVSGIELRPANGALGWRECLAIGGDDFNFSRLVVFGSATVSAIGASFRWIQPGVDRYLRAFGFVFAFMLTASVPLLYGSVVKQHGWSLVKISTKKGADLCGLRLGEDSAAISILPADGCEPNSGGKSWFDRLRVGEAIVASRSNILQVESLGSKSDSVSDYISSSCPRNRSSATVWILSAGIMMLLIAPLYHRIGIE